MTVPIESSRTPYTGNGVTTVFSTGWYFLLAEEVVVKLTPSGGVEVVQTEGVHYTLTMPAGVGAAGSITMLIAPPAASSLVIERDVAFTQLASFRQAGTFDPAAHEDAMDELAFQNQENARRLSDLESAGPAGSVVAGNGLSFSGTTLHVGAGNGIQANADTVEVVFGLVGEIASSGGGAVAGVLNKAARADHVHDFVRGIPIDLVVGAVSDPGVSAYFAASDHSHAVPIGGAGALVDGTPAIAGGSGLFADGAHTHQVNLGISAEELADTVSAAGAGPQLSAYDHVHAHGARGGDTLHALATTALAGFMSAADKTLADARQESISTVQTADATPTLIATFTPVTGQSETVIVTVTAKDKNTADALSYRRVALVTRDAGVTTIRGAVQSIWTVEDKPAADVTIAAATPAITVTVTGIAATNFYWSCHIERRKVVA